MNDLSLLETRVLGTLVEKQHTVPDTYPLTLNSLVSGCNQKTSRSPVMEAIESEVQATLDGLKRRILVIELSGSRVARYAANAPSGPRRRPVRGGGGCGGREEGAEGERG